MVDYRVLWAKDIPDYAILSYWWLTTRLSELKKIKNSVIIFLSFCFLGAMRSIVNIHILFGILHLELFIDSR